MIPRFLADPQTPFPDPKLALLDPDGLLAIGGQLSSSRLIEAYSHGIFPWYGDDQPILWWSPSERALLFADQLKVPRSLKQFIKKQPITMTFDQAFAEVIHHCATVKRAGQSGTWITDEMQAAYNQLHQDGVAHSVEVWREGTLIGGLYGLSMGRAFFGESMFHLAPNGAKIAFVFLAKQLFAWGFDWIDCQIMNPFLASFGVCHVSRDAYLTLLAKSLKQTAPPSPWTPTITQII